MYTIINQPYPVYWYPPTWYPVHGRDYSAEDHYYRGATRASSLVPEPIAASIRAKLFDPNAALPGTIRMLTLQMTEGEGEQVAAYANVANKDGVFVLYGPADKGYPQLYEIKYPVITASAVNGNTVAVTVRIGSGTGYWENRTIVLQATPEGIREVWNGISTLVNMMGGAPSAFVRRGSITIDEDNSRLLYSQLIETYDPNDLSRPVSRECHYEMFRYDEQAKKYVKG